MLILTRNRRQRRGFTLTEAAIVLGIVGLILGAIWVAAASVYNNLRVSRTSQALLQIVQAVRAMHATQNTVDTAANTAIFAQAGVFPSDMVVNASAGVVQDIWGGNVAVAAANTNGTNGDGFSVSFAAVPQGPCTNLLVRNSGTGRDTGLAGAGNAVSNSTSFPLNVTTAVGACASATSNNVVFTFKLKS